MKQPPQVFLPAHGGQLRQIAARYGVPAEQLVDFSANINPAGPPASALAALHRALADPATLAAYPDLELTELKKIIAEASNSSQKNIAVANGFVPLLEATLRSLRISRCLLPVPSFSEYWQTLVNAGVAVVPYNLSEEENFSYDPGVLVQALLEDGCDALLLANPQNPSGVLCEAERMQRLIEMASEHGIKVLLDEAFIDYAPAQSLTRAAAEQENLIVFRSVTKFFAIPGLRVGYAVSNDSSIEGLNRRIAPWPITTLASDAVCAALQDELYAENARRENVLRRTWLEQELARLKIFTYPSRTNFLLLRFGAEVDVHLIWEKMIVEHQIVLRSCINFNGLAAGHLRIAVRSGADNERLIRSLESALARTKE
ncbi:aminotransferase class I/II-fold pyridoxal phosphate-dependent enzyme [Tunturiibacter gelidoferens]|uniref:Threonine-phosphate decarboxylase n=1 Tax=Tunturiibacter gelidiferens TaxID=3069689 RepID=A0ACC5NZY3_9BACT|nr:aminotransferase class I/II-fold pyridoxal phosphate-dependent enzyme [Edaphobacter lichenicola]MBB5340155.1 threonine-phosphate decarboxylase [Edaphobacter lichenicola]